MSLQLSVSPSNTRATVLLSWSGSQPIGIIEYLIFFYRTGSQQIKSISTTSLSTVIPNLINGVTYNFRAAAFLGGYSSGTQLSETSISQVICGTQPDAPADLATSVSVFGAVKSQVIDITWTASIADASHPVLYYNIYLSSDGTNFAVQSTTEPATSFSLTNLLNGQQYTIKVSAVNLVGEGSTCATVQATPYGLAGIPSDLRINFDPNAANSANPGYQSVDLNFTAPTDTGGMAIDSYNIVYSLDPSFLTLNYTVTVSGTVDQPIQDANLMIPSHLV